ncbi:YdcF family protein [Pontixanthobacter aestiaquae]|uniref:YdcF family protein n=1 Tax=Pontixanthobacter aestiaquae TaxID=1509367 RepID=A0A844ZF83_9SPHN|nr:YdcF family protein [Pontixanthobacter aestiaquae]MDN3644584.1 YdcF family protein [Pontixanthobacter aestiaquae]MXO84409.1 YdcF family protein [Pontixanthobacter aestiaquae]
MIRRVFAFVAIIWFAGFLTFTLTLPGPVADDESRVVVVPTGAAGRIERGLELLEADDARIMLVTGVDPEVKPGEFAAQFDVPMDVMQCCVVLGFDAVDTRGNATETAEWLKAKNIRSIRLVTTDWHMRRAANELRNTIPPAITIVEDAVPSEPSLRILFLEYHKFLASRVIGLFRG